MADPTSRLFGEHDLPAQTIATDPADYELGVRFTPQLAGEIVSLRYYRGAADATDTDERTLNLWSATGALLGSVSVVAGPGETGWLTGSLSAPVPVAAAETYVASYGTTQNYSFTADYFGAGVESDDGALVAPSTGNGVFSTGGPGSFPTQTFRASNYWVDVEFEAAGPAPNAPPTALDDVATVPINGATLIPVLDNDADAEDGAPDPTTVEIAEADDAGGKTRTVSGEGVWTVDPLTGAIAFAPEADYSGPVAPIAYTVADSEGLRSAPAQVSVAILPPPPEPNAIVLENRKPGVDQAIWDAPASARIEGFATDISYDNGETVSFKINLDVDDPAGAPYRIEIYRLGYYGGDGAALVATLDGLTGVAQPDPLTDARGLVDAGNWAVSATWLSPEDAVSGVYLAKLVREDDGSTNQIPFVIREDEARADGSKSDIVLQTSDTTWHAYNGWSGNNGQVGGNLYGGFDQPDDLLDDPGLNPDRSFAVSYNRPFLTRDFGGFASGPQDYLFGADYAAIYWLEQNGYDVSYISGVDADRLGPDALLGHKAYISVGHDEYWSGDQRANVEAARDAGVHLLFWSGNEVYWKTRYEPSIDGSGDAYRTLVSYKETWNNLNSAAGPEDYADIDPSEQWTGTWRDLRFADAVDAQGQPTALGAEPENALTGQLFLADGATSGAALDVPAEYAGLRVWRNTAVEGGGALDIAPGILGYEWNVVPDDEWRPDGLIELSRTTAAWPRVLVDQGNTTEPGTLTHNLSLYRAPSGALVFGSGTVFWTWGLSDRHDSSPYGAEIENPIIRQFTVNLLADMGVQPAAADAVLASQGIARAFASSDAAPASAAIDALPATVSALAPVLITGTATDDDGDPATTDGVVAGVEISFDGGATWSPAQGRESWSHVWTPETEGTYEIRARALDDSLNLPAAVALAARTVEVTEPVAPDFASLLDPGVPFDGLVQNDGAALELGLRFEAAESGRIVALRYYRTALDAADLDERAGRLWTADGQLLATVSFSSGPGEVGWQTAALDQPVQVLPDTEYVVSYRTDDFYSTTAGAFGAGFEEPFGTLSAPGGANGVYAYGAPVVFPTQSYLSSNYWVDVAFEAAPLVNTAPVFTSPPDLAVSENALLAGVVAAADGENDPLTFAIEPGPDSARFSIDPTSGALRFLDPPDFEAPADANADNLYELSVSVSDGTAPAVVRAMSVTVADVIDETTPLYSTLFGAADQPDATILDDPAQYELGVKFVAAADGEIAGLRYWRGAADAGDTDDRALNLWTGSGELLASVSVVAAPGEDEWRVGLFGEPVAIAAGGTYVASYGTERNYAFSSGYFAESATGSDGLLTAPASAAAGGNGVYSSAGPGSFPTSTYFASNYWVDPLFAAEPSPSPTGFLPPPPVEEPPAEPFVSSDSFVISRDQVAVGRVVARHPDGDALSYAISGGKHARLFDMTDDGFLFFDAPGNGKGLGPNETRTYALTVTASDGDDFAADQLLDVTVEPIRRPVASDLGRPPDFAEVGPPEQVLFRRADPSGEADVDRGPPDWLREAQTGGAFQSSFADAFEF